jgi:hypothetical protein
LLALFLGLLLGLLAYLDATAAPNHPLAGHSRVQEQPATCLLGVYIQDMRDYQFAQNSLFASVRLWSVCPSTKQSPLNELNVFVSRQRKLSPHCILKTVDCVGCCLS